MSRSLSFFRAGLLAACLLGARPAAHAQAEDDDGRASEWAMEGGKMNAEQAEAMEKTAADARPDQLEAHLKLLGYYFLHRPREPAAREAVQAHILWIVENVPASAVAGLPYVQIRQRSAPAHYAEALAAWQAQLGKNPDTAAVFGNAARFVQLSDPRAAQKYLRRAAELEPANPAWPQALAHLYTLEARPGASALPRAREKALEQYERALRDQTGEKRFYLLTDVAEAAVNAGQPDQAAAYARELLALAADFKENWHYGNAIYVGNSVLGLVALENQDPGSAEKYLLAAGQSPGSPQLDSFGPDLALAEADSPGAVDFTRSSRR